MVRIQENKDTEWNYEENFSLRKLQTLAAEMWVCIKEFMSLGLKASYKEQHKDQHKANVRYNTQSERAYEGMKHVWW